MNAPCAGRETSHATAWLCRLRRIHTELADTLARVHVTSAHQLPLSTSSLTGVAHLAHALDGTRRPPARCSASLLGAGAVPRNTPYASRGGVAGPSSSGARGHDGSPGGMSMSPSSPDVLGGAVANPPSLEDRPYARSSSSDLMRWVPMMTALPTQTARPRRLEVINRPAGGRREGLLAERKG